MKIYLFLLIILICSSCKKTINPNLSRQIRDEVNGKFHGSVLVHFNEEIIINDFFGNES